MPHRMSRLACEGARRTNPSSSPICSATSKREKNAGKSVQGTECSSPSAQDHSGLGLAAKTLLVSHTSPERAQAAKAWVANSLRHVSTRVEAGARTVPLIAVVRNRAHDWWRRQQVEQRHAEHEMKSTPPAAPPLEDWILDSPDLRLDGFVGPGHVSMVIGKRPYYFIPRDHHKPVVIAGFEPLDIIQSVYMLMKQLSEGRAEVENQYARVVRAEGNVKALQAMAQTMELRPFFEWRGLGFITHSALKLRADFAEWDAELRYEVPGLRVADPKACQCGEVLKGVIKPWECKVFGTACTPETPIGTCMVSPEGACAAYFNYGRFSMAAERHRLNMLQTAHV